jgi:hypothetical protein
VTEHSFESAPKLSDDEVRELGYTHRDEDGYWQRPDPERRPFGAEPASMTVGEQEAMMAALVDAYDGNMTAAAGDWCLIKREADNRVAEEIAAIEAWEPAAHVPDDAPHMSAADYDAALERLKPKPTVGGVKRRSTTGHIREWAIAAVEAEGDKVAAAVPGIREETLRAAAWTMSRPDILEHLTADEVASVLIPAAVQAGLSEREARSTVHRTQRARGAR